MGLLGKPTILGNLYMTLSPIQNKASKPLMVKSQNFPTYPWHIPQTFQPKLYEGIPSIMGVWGFLGYVGVLLD